MGLDRFLDKARALARLDHRNIIKVHRFFEAHGTAYIVMEYAEGETLSAFLERKGTLKETELKAILYPILDGLEVLLKQGANVSAENNRGRTPLYMAEDKKARETAEVLRRYGGLRWKRLKIQ